MSSTQWAQTQVQGAELLGEEQRAGPWAGKEVAFTKGLPVATPGSSIICSKSHMISVSWNHGPHFTREKNMAQAG